MIKRHDDVVQSDCQCRNFKLIDRCFWYAFQAAGQLVSEQTGPAALKWRKVGALRLRQHSDAVGQLLKGVGAIGGHVQPLDWVGGNERIPAQLRMPHRTVEEHDMRQAAQSPKCIHRFERRIEPFDQRKRFVIVDATSSRSLREDSAVLANSVAIPRASEIPSRAIHPVDIVYPAQRGRRLAHFVSQIEGVRGVQILRQSAIGAALPQLFEQEKRIRIVQMQFVTDDVHFAAGNENAIIRVLDLARQPIQILRRRFDHSRISEHHQPRFQMLRQHAMLRSSDARVAEPDRIPARSTGPS